MKTITGIPVIPTFAVVAFLGCAVAFLSVNAQSQVQGNNAVYTGSGIGWSSAIIDASAFGGSSKTLCSIIRSIFTSTANPYPAKGAVIDARGLVDSSNANFTCGATESPWWDGSTYQNLPSVILLPAGTITISFTWQLPNQTRLVGRGANFPGQTTGTNLLVVSAPGVFTGLGSGLPTSMIQFGDTASRTCGSGVCFNISVEDLTLNGNNANDGSSQTIDGILNLNSQELTYARRVGLYKLTGTGLHIGSSNDDHQAQNSGPYEQIYYSSVNPSGHCAQIYGLATRGIRGITCIGNTTTPITGAAVLVDSSSNSIEDVYVDGFTEGILLGSKWPGSGSNTRPWGNVLFNIRGGASITNLIHLCGATVGTICSGTSPVPGVADITILGATSGNSGGFTIKDEVTSTTLSDTNVGMYALGDAMNGGYSRFTTSKSVPTWFIGKAAISSPPACTSGSIYSNSSGSRGSTFWACANGSWGSALH